MRAALRTILVTALAVGLLAVFLRNADLSRVWTEMGRARLDLLALAVVLTVLMYVVRAERWQCLLAALGPTRFRTAFRTTIIGFAVSFVLPARAGEIVRPYLLARQEGLQATSVFATIIVERILDLAAVLVLLGLYVLFFDAALAAQNSWLYQAVELGGLVMFPVGLAALAGMTLLAGHPERIHAWVLKAERVLPARLAQLTARLARSFAQGLAVVRQPRRLLLGAAWSLPLWLMIACQIWIVARAFHIAMPFTGAFPMTALLVVGVAVPTPGGVGGVHETFRLGATAFFGADNDAAVGAAILLHAVAFVPVTLLGLVFTMQDGLRIGRLRELAGAASAEGRG